MSVAIVPPKLINGRQMFTAIRAIEASVFLGPNHMGPILSTLSRFVSPLPKVVKGAYTIRNFDWNGRAVIRPCDVHLGVDMWDVGTGQHIFNTTFSEESLATMYATFACGGILFGNWGKTLFRRKDGQISEINADLAAFGLFVSPCGNYAAAIHKNDDGVCILSARYGDALKQVTVPFPEKFDRSIWKALCFEPSSESEVSLIVHGAHRLANDADTPRPLARLNVGQSKFTTYRGVPGLLSIALNSKGDHIFAISADYIYLFEADHFEVITKWRIDERRDRDHYLLPPARYSPCGRYLAYSVGASGDIEVVDARSFVKLARLHTGGLPKIAFDWSHDGRFLATGAFFKSGSPQKLFVWDIRHFRLAAEIEGIRNVTEDCTYMTSYGSFRWLDNQCEFSVLLENGDIVFYKLNE